MNGTNNLPSTPHATWHQYPGFVYVRNLENLGKYCNLILEFQALNVLEFHQRSWKIWNVRLFLVRFLYHVYICDAP